MSVMSLAHFIFNISIEFLKIKKEDRGGAEVATETITNLENSQFQELPAFIELVQGWTKEDRSNASVNSRKAGGLSTRLMILGSFFPFLLE